MAALEKKYGSELASIEFKDVSLKLADKDVVIGDRARKGLDELPRDQQKNVMLGIWPFFMTTISYLQAKLPLDNQLLDN